MSVDAGSPLAGGTSRDFPPIYYAIIRAIDGFSNITGQLISLTMLFLVLSITYEVVARYFFRSPTIWVFESSTMANGSAFMLGCAYALYKGAHVRTDIFWDNYSERTKGIIDLVSYLVLFFPVMITIMAISIDDVDPLLRDRRALAGEPVAGDHVAVPRRRSRSRPSSS